MWVSVSNGEVLRRDTTTEHEGRRVKSIRHSATDPSISADDDYTLCVTWDNVITILGPLMFDEVSEDGMSRALHRFLSDRVEEEYRRSPRVNEEDFHTLKVQLMDLGIIQKSERKRTVRDKGTYWSLTPYGAHYVTKLKAVRRK